MAFHGKAIKPAWNYSFRSDAAMNEHIQGWVDGQMAHAKHMAERKAAASAPHDLKVGDVLHSQWGYEQTNNDYFQVTALIGAHMVEIRKIGNNYQERGGLRANGRDEQADGRATSSASRCASASRTTASGSRASRRPASAIRTAKSTKATTPKGDAR